MNVIDQALNVVQRTESLEGPVTLTLDLAVPEHRAALAAALAVLRSLGEDGETLLAGAEGTGAAATAVAPVAAVAVPEAGDAAPEDEAEAGSGEDGRLRADYARVIAELTPDADRQARVVRETFPRVRDLILDGANVEAVAQIQYRRWVEDNPDYRSAS
ncbi:MAG TPA: hypothetical protein VNK05_09830 [Chloroflexota bacterium]|nr:hypothetical protein [Chloroflexota bacterium]